MWYATKLLLLSLLILQVQAVSAQEGQKAGQVSTGASVSEVPPDTPIITINGLCANDLITANMPTLLTQRPDSTTEKAVDPGCKTVITRGQYEKLVTGIGGKPKPGGPPNFARQLIDMLLFTQKARETGADATTAQEKLRYSYLQSMAQMTMVQMQRQATDITDADAEKYFQEHPERFVRMHLQQISVPKHKSHDDQTSPTKADPAEEEEMHQLALKIQKEAAAGGNIDKLEERAYKAAHDPSVPETDLGEPVAEEVPPEFRKLIFDLQPGQVSVVVANDHEYLIYKCVERHTVPPAERKKLYGWLRMRDSKRALQDMVQTQFNPQYFEVTPVKGQ